MRHACNASRNAEAEYVHAQGPRAKRVNRLGTVEATTPLSGVTAIDGIAVSNDATVLYWVAGASTSAVKRHSLADGSALSDLVSAVAGRFSLDLLVQPDDTLLVSYYKQSAPRSFSVRRYDTAGTLLNTAAATHSRRPIGGRFIAAHRAVYWRSESGGNRAPDLFTVVADAIEPAVFDN
jgi:hypothetical protein